MLAHLIDKLQKVQELTSLFTENKRGIEREALRVTPKGTLAQTAHPAILGSKLTHPFITTDFSESLLEFITPAYDSIDAMYHHLRDIHVFASQHIGDERLWPSSMPCILGSDQEIPIANYGHSNSAKMKMHYRRGLAHRYGPHMQTIAGIHFNYSFGPKFWKIWYDHIDPAHESLQDCINVNTMRLTRNFLRKSWLIYYLMGASPTLHSSFIRQTPPSFLQNMSKETLYGPYATSLRMSPLGYHSLVQDHLNISYNSLEAYIQQLNRATETIQPRYQKITEKYGKEAQLSASTLQIEAEYYASIRPKQPVKRCERPTAALANRGIQYVEVRCIDVNPYEPLGINTHQIHFLETFLVYCLLDSSPQFNENSPHTYRENQAKIAERGRYPIIELINEDHSRSELTHIAKHMLIDMNKVASLLDQHAHHKHYHESVTHFAQQLMDPQTLLSERILNETQRRGDFIPFMLELSTKHQAFYREHPLSKEVLKQYESLAAESLNHQRALEAEDNKSYEEYVNAYFNGNSSLE